MSRKVVVVLALVVALTIAITIAVWPSDADERPEWCDEYRGPGRPPECQRD